MSKKVEAYQCEGCNHIYLNEKEANNCCKCASCKFHIGRWDRKHNYVHCGKGYTCDSYSSNGKKGTYALFEPK